MRNFSTVIVRNFASVSCNDEYFTGDPGEILSDVLDAIAEAMDERGSERVRKAFMSALTSGPIDWDSGLSASEDQAVSDLAEFFNRAKARFWDSSEAEGTETYVYVNLNTGATVAWSSVVF